MKKIALIGDIVSSKKITDRDKTQEKLQSILNRLNSKKDTHLISPYTITLGDEFQALFNQADDLFLDTLLILQAIYPEKIRFSYGIGTIETKINQEYAIGMDGPAFHDARKGIEELKKTSYLFNITGLENYQSNLCIMTLRFVSHNLRKWGRSRLDVFTLLYESKSVKEIAEIIQLSDKAIYKTIDSGDLKTILEVFKEITKIMNESLVSE
jgi:hypothetical protein